MQGDFFDRARSVAVAAMLVAGATIAVGSLLNWIVIGEEPALLEDFDFGEQNEMVEEPEVSEPFTGVETIYGRLSLAAGVVLMVSAALLFLRRRSRWAWLGFLAAVVVGGLALAAYRGVADTSSPLYERLDIVGQAESGIGLTLTAAGAVAGLLSSVAGVVATPRREPDAEPVSG